MKEIEVIEIEKHSINNEEVTIMGIKRIHRYNELNEAYFSYFIVDGKMVLKIKKINKTKEYLLNIDNKINIENINNLMILELSEKLGNINYIVEKEL